MKPQTLFRQLALLIGATSMGVAIALPGFAQAGSTQTNQSPNGVGQPGTTQPGAPIQPGSTTRPGAVQPDTAQPGTAQPGTVQPGATAPAGAQTTRDQYLSDLLQQISATGSFTTLAQAVEASGLSSSLRSQGGEFTIFAPTDEAFAAIPQDKLQRLLQPENRALLQRVLAYHVVPGRVTSDQLQTGGLRTLGGGVAVRVTPERVVINNGSVLRPDIPAQNGVVHAISQVLMPQELRDQILAL
jgi:uncharacterized surface protein with fasciclin (FAS1) repeats